VPQKRERVFFVAVRNDIDVPPLKLAPTHRWISAGEATADLQVLTAEEIADTVAPPSYVTGWRFTKEGGSLSDGKVKAGLRAGGFMSIRMANSSPSPALTSQDQHYLHWDTPRLLTYREWKRLGSFPDDYQAKTDKIGKYMIGMSVPPRMTEQVAKAVIEQWLS
jgi:DNA (cytosine-5)-methyltransferase 1